MTNPQNLLSRTARLLALMAISRARRASSPSIKPQTPAGHQTMTNVEPEPTDEVKALTAELLDCFALKADGQPFPSQDTNTWQAADEAEPEVVSLGFAKFKIIDDATDLALAVGAIDENSPPTLCLRVRFADNDEQPDRRAGQYIALDTGAGVELLFRLWLTGEDVHEPAPEGFDLGPGTDNEALDVLQRGEGLLVQVFGEADEEPVKAPA